MTTRRKKQTELEALQARWLAKTSEPMPSAIACRPIDEVRRAVALTEAGYTFAPGVSSVREGFGCGDSMREWDSDSHG